MKSFIRFGLLCIALICFSNMGISQKKNKKKAKTTIGTKKKKKPIKKAKSKKKISGKKRATTAKYIPLVSKTQSAITTDLPVKSIVVDSMPEKVINIVSAFKPQLKNIAKIGFLNATALVDTNTVVLAYQVPSQNLSFQYQPIALVPRAVKIDSLKKTKQLTSLKVGIGNYFNQLFQVQTSLVDNKDQQHNLNLINESISGDHPIQKWNHFGINYNGSLSISKNRNLHTQIYFDQSNRYRYGLVSNTTKLPLNNFGQKFSVIGANITLVNKQFSNDKLYYAPILKFNNSQLLNNIINNSIEVNSPIHYVLNNNTKINADLMVSYNQYNTLNNQSNQNLIIQLDPSIELNKLNLQLNVGVRPTISNGDFALYPKIELSKKLKDTNYVLHGGWKTSILNYQLIQLMSQNHWIAAPNALPISSIETKYFEVNVTANKRLNYGFNMALNDYRELPFFNQSKSLNTPTQEGLKFEVIFEKRAIAIELKGDLRYQFSDKLLLKNNFKYIQFNLIRENDQAWGVVPFEFNSQFNWLFSKKLQFDASGQFWTGSKTSAGLGNAYKLNNTFVINAGMQYALTDKWTLWGKGENLLDQRYQRWANYPSLGVQILAGIQYKFIK